MKSSRPAAVAGLFYPAQTAQLRRDVASLLDGARAGTANGDGTPKLLVVPHAGYVYSGAVAARAYALLAPLRERITRVVLLGPAHRVGFAGLAAPTVDSFETPLGAVPLDRAAIAHLRGLPRVVESDRAHAGEHSLEVQLPFLQAALASFTLVPLAVGEATVAEVAEVLESLWGGPETLIVISTDLSHFHTWDEARRRDAAAVRRILALEPALDHAQACGATPLNGALEAARRRGLRPRLLDLRNSGDTAGDRNRVVGYCALAFDETTDVRH